MTMEPQHVAVLIPSLEPDDKLLPYVQSLLERGFERIVVVDDGSGPGYQPIFRKLEQLAGVKVLHHEKNLGKGCALKTGFAYLQAECPECPGVVTADSDGQHTVTDVWGLAQRLSDGERGLLLGARDFSLPNVPGKSKAGNRITSFVFWLLYGRWLPDTQTGLRAFASEYLAFMQAVDGQRFEYEMDVLIACARNNVPMSSVPIETVYENENKGTHFHPFRDSMRIYKVIFGNFIKFMSSSFVATAIDLGISFLLMDLLRPHIAVNAQRIFIAAGTARLVSAGFNFLVNKHFVFRSRSAKRESLDSLFRYILLCVLIWLISSSCVTLAHDFLKVSDKLAKMVCDTLLFFVSYRIQQRWVFRKSASRTVRGEHVG